MMKAVLFDCDGVLVNSEALADRAEKTVLGRYGLTYGPEDFINRFIGLGTQERMALFNADYQALHGAPLPDTVAQELSCVYFDLLDKEMKATAGMAALLVRLKDAGVPFAVASNSPSDRLACKLRQVGLYDLFAPHIYGRDQVAHPKPAPDLYEYAAAQLGVSPAECVVVEDSPPGLAAGLAAGGHVVGFTTYYQSPSLAERFLQAAGAHDTASTMEGLAARVAALTGLPPDPGSSAVFVPEAPRGPTVP